MIRTRENTMKIALQATLNFYAGKYFFLFNREYLTRDYENESHLTLSIEQVRHAKQTDSTSCGVFCLKVKTILAIIFI